MNLLVWMVIIYVLWKISESEEGSQEVVEGIQKMNKTRLLT